MAQAFRTLYSRVRATCPKCNRVIFLRKEEIIQVTLVADGVEAVRSAWFGCIPCDAIMRVESFVEQESREEEAAEMMVGA